VVLTWSPIALSSVDWVVQTKRHDRHFPTPLFSLPPALCFHRRLLKAIAAPGAGSDAAVSHIIIGNAEPSKSSAPGHLNCQLDSK
jgi:hypothetical protein